MKKLWVYVFAALLVLTGCKEKNNSQTAQQAEAQESLPAAVPQVAMIKSVMIAGGYWRLVTEGADEGKMKWVEYAVPGTQVQAYGNPDPSSSDDLVEIKRQVPRSTDGAKRDFIHITFEGHDYWAQDYSIVVDAVPGVVMDGNAYIFTQPSPDAMGDKKMDIGTVVGVLNNGTKKSDSFPYAANYVKVNAYINSRSVEGAYLSKDAVSTSARDLLTMQIYEKLNAKDSNGEFTLTDKVARKDLFDTVFSFDLPQEVNDMFLTLYAVDYLDEGVE